MSDHAAPYDGPIPSDAPQMYAARALCPATPPCADCVGRVLDGVAAGQARTLLAELGDPDAGHTFRIAVTSRMSSKVVGDAHHSDSDHFGPPLTLDVRAWSLPAALRKATEIPLSEWKHEDDDDDE